MTPNFESDRKVDLLLRSFGEDEGVSFDCGVDLSKDALHFIFRYQPTAVREERSFASLKSKNERTRKDELWQGNCFELFWDLGGENYWEMNLTPEGDWQVYEFKSCRTGRKEAAMNVVEVSSTGSDTEFVISGKIQAISELFDFSEIQRLHPTVILKKGSQTYFFAVKHPNDKPDFHAKEFWASAL